MVCKVGLVDYGLMGNIENIKRALHAAGAKVEIITAEDGLNQVDKILLPGVGSFNNVMSEIRRRALFEPLKDAIASRPTLGICLGMQILATVGYEFGETEGFDLIEAEVKRIECKGPVPHMGFNTIQKVNETPLFHGIKTDAEFYFMHSYEMVNYTDICSLTLYHGHKFVSAVAKENLFGVQFHPEKSRDQGILLLKNFVEM